MQGKLRALSQTPCGKQAAAHADMTIHYGALFLLLLTVSQKGTYAQCEYEIQVYDNCAAATGFTQSELELCYACVYGTQVDFSTCEAFAEGVCSLIANCNCGSCLAEFEDYAYCDFLNTIPGFTCTGLFCDFSGTTDDTFDTTPKPSPSTLSETPEPSPSTLNETPAPTPSTLSETPEPTPSPLFESTPTSEPTTLVQGACSAEIDAAVGCLAAEFSDSEALNCLDCINNNRDTSDCSTLLDSICVGISTCDCGTCGDELVAFYDCSVDVSNGGVCGSLVCNSSGTNGQETAEPSATPQSGTQPRATSAPSRPVAVTTTEPISLEAPSSTPRDISPAPGDTSSGVLVSKQRYSCVEWMTSWVVAVTTAAFVGL